MHKDEAANLFKVLSDETRVKIVKFLYHNEKLNNSQLLRISNNSNEQLLEHINILLESK